MVATNAIGRASRLSIGTPVKVIKPGSQFEGMSGEVCDVDYSFGGGGDLYRVRVMLETDGSVHWFYSCFWRHELRRCAKE